MSIYVTRTISIIALVLGIVSSLGVSYLFYHLFFKKIKLKEENKK